MALKYILTLAGEIKAGNVDLHIDLKSISEPVNGGGYFHYDRAVKEITLYGSSVDFGSVQKAELLKAFESGKIPRSWQGYKIKFCFEPTLLDAVEKAKPLFNYPKNTEL